MVQHSQLRKNISVAQLVQDTEYGEIEVRRFRTKDGLLGHTFSLRFERIEHLEHFGKNDLIAHSETLLSEASYRFKGKSGYVSSTVEHEGLDSRTDMVDVFEMPIVTHTSGSRMCQTTFEQFGHLPKVWQTAVEVTFEGTMSTRLRNSILSSIFEMAGIPFEERFKKQMTRRVEEQDRFRVQSSYIFGHDWP